MIAAGVRSFRFTIARPRQRDDHTVCTTDFGCLLVFIIQWSPRDLRSRHRGVNIPFAFSLVILLCSWGGSNLLSVGAVDFGIIVDSASLCREPLSQLPGQRMSGGHS